MKLIAIDPSGNHGKEGYGTTGYCVFKDGEPVELGEILAEDYDGEEGYWLAHIGLIIREKPDIVVCEGYKLYHHKGMSAQTQAHSTLQTPQLIGAIKMWCYFSGIPIHIQFASEVKNRWNDDLLARQGILEKRGKRYYFRGEPTNNHKRDALRHGIHYLRYKR